MTNETIDWKQEAAKRKDEFMKDLITLLRIDSVRDDSKATKEAPVGPGPKEALDVFLDMGKKSSIIFFPFYVRRLRLVCFFLLLSTPYF